MAQVALAFFALSQSGAPTSACDRYAADNAQYFETCNVDEDCTITTGFCGAPASINMRGQVEHEIYTNCISEDVNCCYLVPEAFIQPSEVRPACEDNKCRFQLISETSDD